MKKLISVTLVFSLALTLLLGILPGQKKLLPLNR